MISRLTASATVFALVATALIVVAADAAVRSEAPAVEARQVVQMPLVEIVVTRGVRG